MKIQVRATALSALSGHPQPLQSAAWAKIKGEHGWSSHPVSITIEAREYPLLVLSRRLFGPYSLAYIPLGPDPNLATSLEDILVALREHLDSRVFSIRVDLPFGSPLPVGAFAACATSVQPEATIRIDLSGGYAAVQRGYRTRARRAIAAAKAKDITVIEYQGDSSQWEEFVALYRSTAKRQGFFARSEAYLRTLVEADGAALLLGYQAEELLGGIVVLYGAHEAIYLLGASLPSPAPSVSALLQDQAIGKACESGCTVYDLYGVEKQSGGGGKLEKLSLFKSGFGGAYCERPATVEYPYKRSIAHLFRAAERIRSTLLGLR